MGWGNRRSTGPPACLHGSRAVAAKSHKGWGAHFAPRPACPERPDEPRLPAIAGDREPRSPQGASLLTRTVHAAILLTAAIVPAVLVTLNGSRSLLLLAVAVVSVVLVTYRIATLTSHLQRERTLSVKLDEALAQVIEHRDELEVPTPAAAAARAVRRRHRTGEPRPAAQPG